MRINNSQGKAMNKIRYKNAILNIIFITHNYPNEITKGNNLNRYKEGCIIACLGFLRVCGSTNQINPAQVR